tara:strand:+ start:1026 stop:1415 length:390 start_codon:yes stop_codon:yes gene_type:complete
MKKLEKKIYSKCSTNEQFVDEAEFLFKLETRIIQSEANRRTLIVSSIMVFFICILTATQFGAPQNQDMIFYVDEMENILGTDLWNIDSDAINYDETYFNDITYFLLDEDYIWETLELINELTLNEEAQL